MDLCINELAIQANGDLLAHIEACAAQGVRYMEISKGPLMACLRAGHTLQEIKQALDAHGITPACVNSVESISFNGKRGMRVLGESAEFLFYCCRQLGCDCVEVIGSFKVPTDSAEEIAAETASALQQLGDIAKPYGVRLALEYMGTPGSSVRTFRQALDIVRAAGRDNVGLLVDTWHHYAGGSAVEDILLAKPGEICMAHTSDCPEHAPNEALRAESFMPGDGAVPIAEMLANLKAAGYNGALSVEVCAPEIKALPTEEYIARAKASTLPLLQTVNG